MNYSSALAYKYNDEGMPDHIYQDIIITNNTDADKYVPLRFNQIRNSPYLTSPQDYYMSVVRFKLDTGITLPTYIVPIKEGSMLRDETQFTFTLTYLTYEYKTSVEWRKEDLFAKIPQVPTIPSENNLPYYWGYSIQNFVDCLNNALFVAVTGLNAVYNTATGLNIPNHGDMPFFILDETTKRLSLLARADLYNEVLFPNIGIYCNSALWGWIGSFIGEYIGDGTTTFSANGKNYKIRVYSQNNTNFYLQNTSASPPVYKYNALQMFQQTSMITQWSAVQKIVFTTGILPVAPSLEANPVVYNTNQNLLNAGNNANILNVLTDFQEQTLEGAIAFKPQLNYVPTAEYRLLDLLGNNPLSALEISVFWQDKFGNLYPLLLSAGATCSIKLLFRKKNYQSFKAE